jgi:hypothetical protein
VYARRVVEVRDVTEGLWLWRQPHPEWREGLDWGPVVSSFVVESGGEVVLLDPLASRPSAQDVWSRLGRTPPTNGRWRHETPVYAPKQLALVFADGMTAPDGRLRVWGSPWLERRVLPAMREMLALPFEHVLVSHGEPVHTRADFEAALLRDPWEG